MKKLAVLLTLCLLAWSLTGCQPQQTPQPQESGASDVSPSSTAQEGDPVVICIEESFEQDAYELENYLKATGVETEYEFLVLPSRTEDREPELTRLRTELMAGEGPDAFILDATVPGTMTDSGEPLETLFPNVEKSMYSHLFLDLEEMVQNSEIVDLESCNQTVMDVGVTGDGRFLLPLTYTFSALILDPSALEDPGYTFSTLDELLQSDQETLKGIAAWSTLKLFPNCLGALADYEGQNLLVTAESLTSAIQQADAFAAFQEEAYSQSPAEYQGGSFISVNTLTSLAREETEYAILPIPNPAGGVTAAVTFYAAINRNASHPQEAFALIELLYSPELVTEQGFEVGGYHYGAIFRYGYNSSYAIPVKDTALLQYAEDSGLLPGTLASFQGAIERIDSAKVYSDLDLDIYDLYETWHFERPEESMEELVERTISSMEMTLAE